MEILKIVIYLVVGFFLLVKGADWFVDGASGIAHKMHIPSLIIGLTVVAMGTSLPELSVSVTAALSGQNSLAISNVVGSNIFNLVVILGICAVFAPVAVSREVLKRDYPFSIFCSVLLAVLGVVCIYGKGWRIDRVDGLILLFFFVLYMAMMLREAIRARKGALSTEESDYVDVMDYEVEENIKKDEDKPLWVSILLVIVGTAAVKFGGDFTVEGAVAGARMLGVSETLIGLTIVACGTSLPELVTSIVATKKQELEMAVGNVVGSNMFNILMILGVGAIISPMTFIGENLIDILVLTAFSLIIWVFGWTKEKITRLEGISMLVMYGVYLTYICIR